MHCEFLTKSGHLSAFVRNFEPFDYDLVQLLVWMMPGVAIGIVGWWYFIDSFAVGSTVTALTVGLI